MTVPAGKRELRTLSQSLWLPKSNLLLYAATTADLQTARGIAAALGLPSTSIQNDFSIVWEHVSSGSYQVIAIWGAALDSLYFNPCGWRNPINDPAGGTPLSIVGPTNTLPGPNNFVNGAGSTAAETLYISAAYAYYALYGSYPSEFQSPPKPEGPSSATCGSHSGFTSNSTVICCAQQASKSAQVPVALLLAQWAYEGANVCTSIAAKCNSPANANAGLFDRCSSSYTASSCSVSGDSGYAGASSGLSGALMNADVFNAGYCLVAITYQNSTLTTGV